MDEVDTAFLTLIAQQEMPAASSPNHHARRQRQRQSQAAIIQRLLSMLFWWLHVYTWYIYNMCRHPTPHTAAVTKKRAPGALPWCQPYFDTTMVLRAWTLSPILSSGAHRLRSSTPFKNSVMHKRDVCGESSLYRNLAQNTHGIPFYV